MTDADEVDLDLIASLLRFLCSHDSDLSQLKGLGNADEGAVLVFLPGWDEIMRLRELLESQYPFNLPGRSAEVSIFTAVLRPFAFCIFHIFTMPRCNAIIN